MTDKPKEISAFASPKVSQEKTSQDKAKIPESVTLSEKEPLSDRNGFLIGAAAGGFLSLVALMFSMEMAHTPLVEVSAVSWGVVLLTTLIFGVLGLKFKHQFLDALDSLFSLPF